MSDEAEEVHLPDLDDFWCEVGGAEMKPPEWIIEDVLPPGLVIVGGPAKSMKTTVSIGLANLISGHPCGLLPPFMSKAVRTGRVMLLEAEHDAGELRYMIEKDMGVALRPDGSVMCARDPSEFRLDDPGALKRLMGWLDAYKPRLFMIDPLREFHESEEKDSGEMQRLMRPLRRWALENGSCVLCIHHTSKPGEGHTGSYSPLELRGSSAFSGMANGMLMVTPRSDGVVTITSKFKRGASYERTIQLGIWGQRASELLSGNDASVLRVIASSAWPMDKLPTSANIAASLKRDLRSVSTSLALLRRNGLVDCDDADCWVATGGTK